MGNKFGDIKWKWLSEKGFNVLKDENQHEYMKSLFAPPNEVQAVFCDSRAGTGKTTLAVLAGVYEVEAEKYDKIIYIRNTIPIRDQGFLPGGLNEKEAPYMEPLIQAMDNVHPALYYKWAEENDETKQKKVYAFSSSFARGVTYDNAFIIIDETQNMDLHELHAIYTRPTDNCKIVTIGCTRQIDNPKLKRYNGKTPFELYMEHFKDFRVAFHELTRNYRGEFSNLADEIKVTVDLFDN